MTMTSQSTSRTTTTTTTTTTTFEQREDQRWRRWYDRKARLMRASTSRRHAVLEERSVVINIPMVEVDSDRQHSVSRDEEISLLLADQLAEMQLELSPAGVRQQHGDTCPEDISRGISPSGELEDPQAWYTYILLVSPLAIQEIDVRRADFVPWDAKDDWTKAPRS